ncbi:uncharacterized protein LOC135275750 [Aotus nancymaae]|uniref:uncharacterized protein LOC135275750 n=1 Tax=Aotus nancymaae TaxID=37293 RepID=UPI0030FE8580
MVSGEMFPESGGQLLRWRGSLALTPTWPSRRALRPGPQLQEPEVCDPVLGPAMDSVQTRENRIAYPLQSAENGIARRLQIREGFISMFGSSVLEPEAFHEVLRMECNFRAGGSISAQEEVIFPDDVSPKDQ